MRTRTATGFISLSALALSPLIILGQQDFAQAAPSDSSNLVCQVYAGEDSRLSVWQDNNAYFYGEYVSLKLLNQSDFSEGDGSLFEPSEPLEMPEVNRQIFNEITLSASGDLNPLFVGTPTLSQGVNTAPPEPGSDEIDIELQNGEPSFYESATISTDQKTLLYTEDGDHATDSDGDYISPIVSFFTAMDDAASAIEFSFEVDLSYSGTVTLSQSALIPESMWQTPSAEYPEGRWLEFNPDTDYVQSGPLICEFEVTAQEIGEDEDETGNIPESPTPPEKVDTAFGENNPNIYGLTTLGILSIILIFSIPFKKLIRHRE